MANKKYVNDSMQNSTFQVNSHKPMDDRLVIRLRENLMQSETWQLTSNGDVMLYSGIIVNVIDDTDANNGLYSLKNWTKYDKQSWDETDDLTYDADGWKMLTNDNKSDFYIITITETRNSGAYTLTCDKTAEEMSNNVLISGKTPIFRLVVSEFGEYTYPAVLSQMPGSYAEDGEVTGVWYWEATMSYIHNNKKIDYHILSEYYLDGSNDSVSITRDEQAIGDSKIYWCHWDEGNSTVVGLTPLQICQLTSDGCIVKCYFYDGGDRYIYDLINCANYGNDDFWILFCRSGDVNSSECIEYFSSEGWSLYANTHTPTQSDWNQTNTTAPDYIKNKPQLGSDVYVITITETESSGTYTFTSDRTAEQITDNVVVSGKTPIFVLMTMEGNGDAASPIILDQRLSGITTSGSPINQWYYSLDLSYNYGDNTQVIYGFESVHNTGGTNDTVTITRSTETIAPQADWNQSNSLALDYIKNKPTFPTVRTINGEQLTDSSLDDINIHDGYYFPNAVQDYDGNWYGAVIIGDQVWMAENLKTTHYSDGTSVPDGSNATNVVVNPQPYYYHVNNDASLDDEYGLLYNWMAVMNGASETNANPSGVQGVAPVGWHIPSGSEVDALTQYVSNQKRFIINNVTSNIAKSLAYHSLWNSSSASTTPGTNQNDNNKTGFAAKPAGSGYIDMSLSTPVSFDLLGANFRMWTTNYVEFVIPYNYSSVSKWPNPSIKYFGHSVRCISDLTPIQFRNWYVETYGTMQHHLNENIIVNQNYDLYRCVMSYDAWINVMGSGEYPTGTYLTEFTVPTNNPYIILNHVDKPVSNPIIISKFNATNGQYEPLLPQQQSFVGLNNLIANAATNDHGAYQFELLPDMVNPVYHVFDIQHGLYAVWHKNGDAAMGNASTVYQGILIGVTTSIGNDTEEIAFMIKIYKNSIQQ